jgi:hypothetical protein
VKDTHVANRTYASASLPPLVVSALADFYDKRGNRMGKRADSIEELTTFLALPDAPAWCVRVCARLMSLLLPNASRGVRDESPNPTGDELCRSLSAFLDVSTPRALIVASSVLSVACGVADPSQRALVASLSDDDADCLDGSVAALHVCVDAVHAASGDWDVPAGAILRQMVTTGDAGE